MGLQLKRYRERPLRNGPLLLVIMDGVGLGAKDAGDAVHHAYTPHLDALMKEGFIQLRAHGRAVGMPSDKDMGNSEVGHNALGAGRVFEQGASLVKDAIETRRIFESDAWSQSVQKCQKGGSLHFIGLLSDGNVHSHESHLHAMIQRAHEEGVQKLFVHTLLDGRDVPERSALEYIGRLEDLLSEISGNDQRDYRIASGGGRMITTMDRYDADWSIVERGWNAHVHGKGRAFTSAQQAIETYREELKVNDQYLPPFVVVSEGTEQPVGPVGDGDAVIFYNFRGDRAIEITKAFEQDEFDYFDRGQRPDVFFAGMMQYDGDLQLPKHFLVAPPAIDRTLGEYMASEGIRQYAISETQKYGHVTYFWNGNRSGFFNEDLEKYVEITSDLLPYEQRPWMKAAEITDLTIEAMRSGEFDFLRLNFPNGDMVGHTGSLEATMISVATVDLCLGRLMEVTEALGGVALITADHGNADEMFFLTKDGQVKKGEDGRPAVKTSHSLNPVPFIIYDPQGSDDYTMASLDNPGLSSIAATILHFLGFEPPEDYDTSLILPKELDES